MNVDFHVAEKEGHSINRIDRNQSKVKFLTELCVSFPLSRIQSTCFASVFSSALTLTPFSRIFRCSQSNCAPAMADHPFFSLADARLCHLGHTHTPHHRTTWNVPPPHYVPRQASRSVMSQLELCSLEKKEALVLAG